MGSNGHSEENPLTLRGKIEWVETPYDAELDKPRNASRAPVKLKTWGRWTRLVWWILFILSIPWAAVFGLAGVLMVWFPPFALPLIALAGWPCATLIAIRLNALGWRKR